MTSIVPNLIPMAVLLPLGAALTLAFRRPAACSDHRRRSPRNSRRGRGRPDPADRRTRPPGPLARRLAGAARHLPRRRPASASPAARVGRRGAARPHLRDRARAGGRRGRHADVDLPPDHPQGRLEAELPGRATFNLFVGFEILPRRMSGLTAVVWDPHPCGHGRVVVSLVTRRCSSSPSYYQPRPEPSTSGITALRIEGLPASVALVVQAGTAHDLRDQGSGSMSRGARQPIRPRPRP